MFTNFDTVLSAVQTSFGHATILVVGDLMLDRYIWGEVNRISPEAPVPVVRWQRESENPGGAANVAMNLAGLGLKVTLAGFAGDDADGKRLLGHLSHSAVDASSVTLLSQRPTTQKIRVFGGHQQMLRLDIEDTHEPSADLLQQFVDGVILRLRQEQMADASCRAIILSDYAKGALAPSVCQSIITTAKELGIPVIVDPKGKEYRKYSGATAISLNQSELAAITLATTDSYDDLLAAAQELRHSLDVDFLVLTRGEQGMTLIETDGTQHADAITHEVFDVSGAGDTVIATLTAGLATGLSRIDAVHLANVAAGIVVGKVGTVPIGQQELYAALLELPRVLELVGAPKPADIRKICGLENLLQRTRDWRSQGETIVFTNGCFDLLHVGHVAYLELARREGDRLIVGLNGDGSVRRLKGENRPINSQEDRARVLAALASVDAVILFDEDTPINLLNAVRPDVLVKGGDYTEDQVVGAELVRSWGGRVTVVPFVGGRSTTSIIKRIETTHGPGR